MSPPRADDGPATGLGLPPLAVVLLALAGAALAAFPLAHPYANPDSRAFEAIARSLLAGQGLRYREPMLPWLDLFAFRSPGYPVLLAPLLALGGVKLALAVNGAMHALTAVLAGEIVARAASRRAGVMALALGLAWAPAWLFAGQLLSETLFVFLSAASFAAAQRARGARGAALAGVLAAAATLTRPVGVAVAAGVLVLLARRAPKLAFAALLACAVAYAPWPLRNQRVLGEPVLFTTNAGFNLCDGVTPGTTHDLWVEMSGWAPLGELAIDHRWRERHDAIVRANPTAEAKRWVGGMARDVIPLDYGPQHWLHRAITFLALAGAFLTLGTPEGLGLAIAWWGQGAINALAQVSERYRFPGEWIAVVFAALAVHAITRRAGCGARWGVAGLLFLGGLVLLAQVVRHPG